jgi:hypothetical protein
LIPEFASASLALDLRIFMTWIVVVVVCEIILIIKGVVTSLAHIHVGCQGIRRSKEECRETETWNLRIGVIGLS